MEFLIIFLRWLNTVFTTRKNNLFIAGKLLSFVPVSRITPELTSGGG